MAEEAEHERRLDVRLVALVEEVLAEEFAQLVCQLFLSDPLYHFAGIDWNGPPILPASALVQAVIFHFLELRSDVHEVFFPGLFKQLFRLFQVLLSYGIFADDSGDVSYGPKVIDGFHFLVRRVAGEALFRALRPAGIGLCLHSGEGCGQVETLHTLNPGIKKGDLCMLRAHSGNGFLQGGPVLFAGLVQAYKGFADIDGCFRIQQGNEGELGAVGVPHAPSAVESPVSGLAQNGVSADIFSAEGGVEGA